tara:strand:+ start:384 stop:722 length:339 start_codon:yes stop_codon:yes gene_type:complete
MLSAKVEKLFSETYFDQDDDLAHAVSVFDLQGESVMDMVSQIVDVDELDVTIDDPHNRVYFDTLENGEGYQASKTEIEEWKAGKTRLFSCSYYVDIFQHIPLTVTPSHLKVA